jgi:hypothetical protein
MKTPIRSSLVLSLLLSSCLFLPSLSSAQGLGSSNPTQTSFQIVVCNGPALPASIPTPKGYVPCDFKGAMIQVQRLIDIAMVLGVLAAIGLFIYAGFLYMTGSQGNIDHAKSIFPKVLWGFIIMLTAWFIVYQILSWLTGSGSGFAKLLGNP